MKKKWIYLGLVVVAVVVAGWAARPIAMDRLMAWRIGLPAPSFYISVDEDVSIVMPERRWGKFNRAAKGKRCYWRPFSLRYPRPNCNLRSSKEKDFLLQR